jgi:ATP-binding cassette subfamily C protein
VSGAGTPGAPSGAPRPPRRITVADRIAVTSGSIAVFIQAIDPMGPRIPVTRVHAPDVLQGAAPPDGYQLIVDELPAVLPTAPASTPGAVIDLAPLIQPALAQHARAVADEEVRLSRRANADQTAITDALDAVALVMDQPDFEGVAAVTDREALQQVFAKIGGHLGVRFPDVDTGVDLPDPVVDIANMAGCRARPVLLTGDWSPQAIEPIIGFRGTGADSRPVALIARREGHYEVHDPREQRVMPLSAVSDLNSEGYALTRPLPADAESAWAFLKWALRNAKSTLNIVVITAFIAALAGLVTPLVTTLFFNLIIPEQSTTLLLEVTVLLLGAAAALALLLWTRNIALLRLEGVLQQEMEPAIWNHMLRLPSGFFRRFTAGDLVQRVQGIDTIRQLIGGSVLTSFLTLIFSVVNVGLLFFYSVSMGFVVLIAMAVVITLIAWINIRNIRNQRMGFTAMGKLSGFLFQLLGAVPKVRVAGAEPQVLVQWAQGFRMQQLATFRSGRAAALSTALTSAFATFVTTVVVIYGGLELRTTLSTGAFLGFLSAAGAVTAAVAGMAFSFGPLGACVSLFERLQPIIEEPEEQSPDAVQPGRLTGAIRMFDVAFRYSDDGPLILDGFNLAIEPGEFVAITGPSGSGKSTILKVMLGLEMPEQGSVTYDDMSLLQLDRAALRRQIGVVMQEAHPMPGPLLEAIIGQSGRSEDDAWKAVEAVGLAGEIKAMPMGMRTMISAGAGGLSGGQLQRVLVARALITRPSIIFFDEATSALDNVAQAKVTDSVAELNATRVVIAHRIATIKMADKIVVVDKGQVVQTGTFDELSAAPGLFRDLVMLELDADGADAEPHTAPAGAPTT